MYIIHLLGTHIVVKCHKDDLCLICIILMNITNTRTFSTQTYIEKQQHSHSQRQLILDFRTFSKQAGCPGDEYLVSPRDKYMRSISQVFMLTQGQSLRQL